MASKKDWKQNLNKAGENDMLDCDNCKREIKTGDYWAWFGDEIYCESCYEKVKDDD